MSIARLVPWLTPGRRKARRVGGFDPNDARQLADAERRGGLVPDGGRWLDDRTVADVDLPLVFRAIDRTSTSTGAQTLWRWLVAPSDRLDVLAAREAELAALTASPARGAAIRDALPDTADADAVHLTGLLWGPPARTMSRDRILALLAALIGTVVLAVWIPKLIILACLLFGANVVIDDWTGMQLADQARALELLRAQLFAGQRVLADRLVPAGQHAALAADLAAVTALRTRIGWLALRDPFQIIDLLRAGLLLRPLILSSCAAHLERERARLRRIVLAIGELDALVSIAVLRRERADAAVPELSIAADRDPVIDARALVHPAISDAIGNDVSLAGGGMLITGSNMSGKSTFLRTLAINAICAQSIHTTFGTWRASLLRTFAVMRIADDPAQQMSTYAVEVAAIHELVAATRADDAQLPALFVLDEPFSGTNPAVRVPIVVSVLTYLAARDLVIAATHDLDVAAQLDVRFQRGYFVELDGTGGTFDRRLRPGVAPGTNAIVLLERAGYPAAILTDLARRAAPKLEPRPEHEHAR